MLENAIIILLVVTVFRGWLLFQLNRRSWEKGGLSRKTLLMLNTFSIVAALMAAVILAYNEENGTWIGMIGLLAFWFISILLGRVFTSLNRR